MVRNILITIITNIIIVYSGVGQNFKHYTIKEGLIEWNVYSISQKSDGEIVFATDGGISIFDGINFNNYNTTDGLVNNYVNYVFEDNNKNLIISTYDGISIFDGFEFKNIRKDDGLNDNLIWSATQINDSTVWLATAKGIMALVNYHPVIIEQPKELSSINCWHILKSENYGILLATDRGIWSYKNEKFEQIESENLNSKIAYYYLLEDELGNLWAGSREGLLKFDSKKYIFYNNVLKQKNVVFWLAEDKLGGIWLATQYGVVKFENDKFTDFGEASKLSNRTILTVFSDSENNLWIGSTKGASMLGDKRFQIYANKEKKYGDIWSLFSDSKNQLWVGTDKGLYHLKNEEYIKYENTGFSGNTTIWDVFEDSKKRLWFGYDDGYAVKIEDKFIEYRGENFQFNDAVMSFAEDSAGNMWFGTYQSGLLKKTGKSFIRFTKEDGLCSDFINKIFFDSQDNLWILTANGICRYKEGKITTVITDDIELNNFSFYCGDEDQLGNYWFGSYELGIIHIRENAENVFDFKVIDKESGLNHNTVLLLKIDYNNTLWAGTNKGLNKLDIKKYYRNEKNYLSSFDYNDGLPGIEVNQNAIHIDKNNDVYFGTIDGIVSFDASKKAPPKTEPVTKIKNIEIFLEKRDLTEYGDKNSDNPYLPENLVLPYNLNHIKINFIGIHLTNPNKVYYKYKMEGLNDSEYIKKNITSITYGRLEPGEYTFNLWTSLTKNFDGKQPEIYHFEIIAPFYKTLIFNLGMAIFILTVSIGGYTWRTRRVRKRNLELEKIISEKDEFEEKLIQSEKDYRGLFENAHDAIIIIDPVEHKLVDVNLSSLIMYGYTKGELKGKHIKQIIPNIEKGLANIETILQQGRKTKIESTHLKKDGEEFTVEINATEIIYKEKKAILVILRDISERKLVEQSLRKAKEEAEKSNRLKTEFLAQMSHEIRTPINTILNFNSLICEEVNENIPEDLNESFSLIERAGRRIIRTIDLLLNMAQIQTGTYEPTFIKMDIADRIVENLISDYKYDVQKKGLTLTMQLNTEDANVIIDEYTVSQILHNLIDNAIKYTNSGGIEIELQRDNNDKLVILIKDTGIGIAEEFIPQLFEAFSQEETGYTRKYEGNGLGLALVKSYCLMNNIDISVESKKGEGSVFKLVFNKSD